MRVIFIILSLFFIPVSAWGTTAGSCSYDDVLTAYGDTSAEGTLTIPECDGSPTAEATWSSTLTVSKSINIIGQGSADADSTRTIINSGVNPVFLITASDVRISGIRLKLTGSARGIKTDTADITGLRVDNNYISGGGMCFEANAGNYTWGVLDSNVFENCHAQEDGHVYVAGDNADAWARDIEAGTGNALFIENNTFIVDNDTNAPSGNLDAFVYIQEAANVVVRYNLFDASGWTVGTNYVTVNTNNHGNMQGYWNGGNQTRGSPLFEFYNNESIAYRAYQFHGIRGGSVIIHDNTYEVTGSTAPEELYKIQDLEYAYTSWFSPSRTAWPSQDGTVNSFIWDELYTGPTPVAISNDNQTFSGTCATGCVPTRPQIVNSDYITMDKDIFMHTPAATGGKSSYTGARKGGSQSYPTGPGDTYPDTGDTEFSSSGANAYYPYTPYQCPHPLTGLSGSCDEDVAGFTGYNVVVEVPANAIQGVTIN